MLYDNAQLLEVYAGAAALYGDDSWKSLLLHPLL
jgi:uncharacterized protein YyaL (SSP411 family)